MFEFNSSSANQRESLQRFIHREKFTSMLRKVKATLRKLTKDIIDTAHLSSVVTHQILSLTFHNSSVIFR